MLDNEINKILKPSLENIAFILIKRGISANSITFLGFLIGILSFIFLINGDYYVSLIFFFTQQIMRWVRWTSGKEF